MRNFFRKLLMTIGAIVLILLTALIAYASVAYVHPAKAATTKNKLLGGNSTIPVLDAWKIQTIGSSQYIIPRATNTTPSSTTYCLSGVCLSSFGSANAITGSGTSTYVTFFNTSTTITGDSNFVWDNVNKDLTIGAAPTSFSFLSVQGTATTTSIGLNNELDVNPTTNTSATFKSNNFETSFQSSGITYTGNQFGILGFIDNSTHTNTFTKTLSGIDGTVLWSTGIANNLVGTQGVLDILGGTVTSSNALVASTLLGGSLNVTTSRGLYIPPVSGSSSGNLGTFYGAEIDPPGKGSTQWTLLLGGGSSNLQGNVSIGTGLAAVGTLDVLSSDPNRVVQIVEATSTQVSDLEQWQSSSNNALDKIGADGFFTSNQGMKISSGLTFDNASGTNTTSTNIFVSNATNTNLFVSNYLGTNGTSTNWFVTNYLGKNVTTTNFSAQNIMSSLIPITNGTLDVGSSSNYWNNGYFLGNVTSTTATANNATFTNLTVSSCTGCSGAPAVTSTTFFPGIIWTNATGTNTTSTNLFATNLGLGGSINLNANNAYDIGSRNFSLRNIYVSSTSYLGGGVSSTGGLYPSVNAAYDLGGPKFAWSAIYASDTLQIASNNSPHAIQFSIQESGNPVSVQYQATGAGTNGFVKNVFITGNNTTLFGIEHSSAGGLITGDTANATVFGNISVQPFQLATNNTVRWTIDKDGMLLPGGSTSTGTNTYNIGGSGRALANIYVSGTVFGGTVTGTTGNFNTINLGSSLPITSGGTGVSTLPTGLLTGNGTSAITATTSTAWTSCTPTVSLLGGLANTVPQYVNNGCRYRVLGDVVFMDVDLNGATGNNGGGTGQLAIALPINTSLSSNSFGDFPCGGYVNISAGNLAYCDYGANSSTVALSSSAIASMTVQGSSQSGTDRSIKLHFFYDIN